MPAILLYSLKLSVCLGVIYLFYYLALRNITFYNWNRWFFLLGTAICFLLPLVNVLPLLQSKEADNFKIIRVIPNLENLYNPVFDTSISPEPARYVFQFILILFRLGVLMQGGKLVIQFVSFFRLRQSATLLQDGIIKIYQIDKNIAPFSFGNAIFLNKNLLQPTELEEIIRHELVHIRQKHTVDVLWFGFLTLVNWYNPFVWLLKRAVRQNLEFLVDREILMTPNLDKKYYQYLLLKINGLPDFTIANQFNISSLKTRINMMNKKPSNQRELGRFLLILPLMATLLLACSDKVDSTFTNLSTAQKNKTQSKVDLKEVPLPPPPPPVVITTDKLPTDHKSFLKRNPQVNNIFWHKEGVLLLIMKSGQTEEYDLKNEDDRIKAEKKYGNLPKPLQEDITIFKPPVLKKD